MNPFITAAATVTAIGTVAGSVWTVDTIYVRKSAFEEINWSLLKESIRDIRREMRENPGDPDLPFDLQDAVDRLCRNFPEDRECRDGDQ